MTTLAVTIGLLIAETMTAVVALACFALFLRQYRHSRQLRLLPFLVAYAALALGLIMSFLGQVLGAESARFPSIYCAGLFVLSTLSFPFLISLGLSCLIGGKQRLLRAVSVLTALVVSLSLGLFWLADKSVDPASGLFVIGHMIGPRVLLVLSWSALAILLLSSALLKRFVRGSRLYMAIAGICLIVGMGILAFMGLARSLPAVMLAATCMMVFLGLTTLLVVAQEQVDSGLAKHPADVIRRSLLIRVVLFSVSAFWAVSFLVIVAAVSRFVGSDLSIHQEENRSRVARISKCLLNDRNETVRLAEAYAISLPPLPSEIDHPDWPQERLDLLASSDPGLLVRLLDRSGRVVFSNYDRREVGTYWPESPLVRAALAGRRAAAIERDAGYRASLLVAAVPVSRSEGGHYAILLSRLPGACLDQDRVAGQTQSYSFGVLDAQGQTVTASGSPLALNVLEAVRSGNLEEGLDGPTLSGGLVSLKPVTDSDSQIIGYGYSQISRRSLQGAAVKLAGLIILVMLFGLLVLSVILVHALSMVVRPLRELKQAADAVESGVFSQRIRYDRQDELGQLARAFNAMSRRIGQQRGRLELKMKEQMDFLINTAREMQTPLNVFRWTVDLMKYGDSGRLNKNQLELVEQLGQTTRRLTGLVQNLLDTAKLDQGDLALESDRFQLADVLDEAAGSLTIRMREKNIDFVWKRPEKDMPEVMGDRERCLQIAVNLLTNALKYTDKGGRIVMSLAQAGRRSPVGPEGKYLEVSVEDNGIGVPDAEQPRLFDRFYRASNAVAADIEGAGLGLYIVRQLASMQGGSAWFDSSQNIGSVFRFSLPQATGRRSAKKAGSGKGRRRSK